MAKKDKRKEKDKKSAPSSANSTPSRPNVARASVTDVVPEIVMDLAQETSNGESPENMEYQHHDEIVNVSLVDERSEGGGSEIMTIDEEKNDLVVVEQSQRTDETTSVEVGVNKDNQIVNQVEQVEVEGDDFPQSVDEKVADPLQEDVVADLVKQTTDIDEIRDAENNEVLSSPGYNQSDDEIQEDVANDNVSKDDPLTEVQNADEIATGDPIPEQARTAISTRLDDLDGLSIATSTSDVDEKNHEDEMAEVMDNEIGNAETMTDIAALPIGSSLDIQEDGDVLESHDVLPSENLLEYALAEEELPIEDNVEDDGWRLYFSTEGYPYYYNEHSGESQWAQVDADGNALPREVGAYSQYETAAGNGAYDYSYDEQYGEEVQEEENGEEEEEDDDDDEDDEDDDDDDDDDDDSDDEEEEEEESAEKLELDEELEAKFKAYLKTPEGMAAVLAEQERIQRYVEKKEEKQRKRQEREYAKRVLLSKKRDDLDSEENAEGESVFKALIGGFKWIAGAEEAASKKAADRSSEPVPNRKPPVVKFDDFGRESKQRKISSVDHENPIPSSSSAVNRQKSSRGSVSSTSSHGSSTGSSEVDSMDSDDSDVEVMNQPLVPELPAWMRIENLYGAYIGAIINREMARTIANQSLEVGERVLSTASTVAYDAAIATGQSLYPYLVHFMQTVVDGGIHHQIITGSVNEAEVVPVETTSTSGRIDDTTRGNRNGGASNRVKIIREDSEGNIVEVNDIAVGLASATLSQSSTAQGSLEIEVESNEVHGSIDDKV